MITIAVNPKEYFEEFKYHKVTINKKHKEVRKIAPGMLFYNYAKRLLSLSDHKELYGADSEKQIEKCLQVKNGKTSMTTITKSKFTQLNDKKILFLCWRSFIAFFSSLTESIK